MDSWSRSFEFVYTIHNNSLSNGYHESVSNCSPDILSEMRENGRCKVKDSIDHGLERMSWLRQNKGRMDNFYGRGNFRSWIRFRCLLDAEFRVSIAVVSGVVDSLFRNPPQETCGVADIVPKAVARLTYGMHYRRKVVEYH